MKKLLLLVVVALMSLTTVNAQILSTQNWNKTLQAVNATDAAYDGSIVVAEDGSVFVSGTSTKEFEVDANLTIPAPFSTGSYIIKYNADGTSAWGALVDGDTKITSMTVDSKGVLYVAGSFAGETWVYSSDFTTYTEITGKGAFIAKYKADGAVEFVRTIIPETDATVAESGGYWEDLSAFNIYKIQAEGSNLYVGATYCGDATIKDYTSKGAEDPAGDIKIEGKYAFIWSYIYADMPGSVVFSYATSKMNNPAIVADISSNVNESIDITYRVQTANFVADGSNVYVAAMGYGNFAVTTENGKQDVSFFTDGDGTTEAGLVVVKTGATDVVKVYNNAQNRISNDYYNVIDAMEVTNGTLYMTGTFRGNNPFDNASTTEATSTSDIFVASLKASTLEKNWAVETPDKGDTENQKYENISGTIIYPAGIQIAASVKDVSSHASESYYNYAIDFEGNVTALTQAAAASVGNNNTQAAYSLTMAGMTFVYAGDLKSAEVYEGVAGDDVIYTFTPATGTIAFTGSGAMYEYESADEIAVPWAPFKADITTATIADGITNVPGYAFSKCAQLDNVTIPSTVTVISRNAFASCEALTAIEIPSSVNEIGLNAFNACAFTNVTIPNSVTTMGNTVFSGCTSLESVTLSKSMSVLPTSTFNKCSALKEVYIPESYTTINFGAFHSCSSLETVTLAASVDSIGGYAFYNNTSLSKIYSMNTVPPAADAAKIFDGVLETAQVFVPVASVDAYAVAAGWEKFFVQGSDFTGVEDAVIENGNITVKGNAIVVEGYAGKVQVVSISGQVVKDMIVNEFAEIEMPQGLYIVVTANGAQKVIVK